MGSQERSVAWVRTVIELEMAEGVKAGMDYCVVL